MRLDLAIKAGRALRGLSQRQLAIRLHIPRTNVVRWEARRTAPSPGSVERIAGALELSPRVFIEAALLQGSE